MRNEIRQTANTTSWESITKGLIGRKSINPDKLQEEGPGGQHIPCWDSTLTPVLCLFGSGSRGGGRCLINYRRMAIPEPLKSITPNERDRIWNFSASNSMWKLVTGTIDTLLRYTDECSIWINCPVLGARQEFWGRMAIISTCMRTDGRRAQCAQRRLVRLLRPGRRFSIHLDRISPTFPPDNFAWASLDSTLGYLGGSLLWRSRLLPLPHQRI